MEVAARFKLNVPLSSCHAKPKLNAKSTDLPQLLSRMEMNRSIANRTDFHIHL
jgi:hypothetical protein